MREVLGRSAKTRIHSRFRLNLVSSFRTSLLPSQDATRLATHVLRTLVDHSRSACARIDCVSSVARRRPHRRVGFQLQWPTYDAEFRGNREVN